MEKLYMEDQMEKELVVRGHDIYDEDKCIDSVKVVDIAIDVYGFKSKMNENDILEFVGSF